jgi:hypothetical protein
MTTHQPVVRVLVVLAMVLDVGRVGGGGPKPSSAANSRKPLRVDRHRLRGRPPAYRQVFWYHYSYKSGTSARPLASTPRWRASSVRCAHFLAGSRSVFLRAASARCQAMDSSSRSRIPAPNSAASSARRPLSCSLMATGGSAVLVNVVKHVEEAVQDLVAKPSNVTCSRCSGSRLTISSSKTPSILVGSARMCPSTNVSAYCLYFTPGHREMVYNRRRLPDRHSPGRHAAGTPHRSGRRAPGGGRPVAGPRVSVRIRVRYASRPAQCPGDRPGRITEGRHSDISVHTLRPYPGVGAEEGSKRSMLRNRLSCYFFCRADGI